MYDPSKQHLQHVQDNAKRLREAAQRNAERARQAAEDNRRRAADARRRQLQLEKERAQQAYAHPGYEPDDFGEAPERGYRRGVPAWRRLLRTAVCGALMLVLMVVSDASIAAANQGRADPQSAQAVAQIANVAILVLAVVGFYNFIRMVFRILANLFR
jgi:hypothetical protein